ncbi:MAG: histidine phosphatase family protein [Pseudomonadota bacterium]
MTAVPAPHDPLEDTPTPDLQVADEPVRGPIIISRHGRPALNRKLGPRLTWREYIDWWARYETGSLAEGQIAPESLKKAVQDADLVLTSQRPRAQETAALAAPHADAEIHALFNEAPLPPPRLPGVRYLPKTWNVLARSAWLTGHSLDGESVAEARARAGRAADHLHEASRKGKVYLAAHGWFNRMLRPELRARGWREVQNGGDAYWSFRVFEYHKQR